MVGDRLDEFQPQEEYFTNVVPDLSGLPDLVLQLLANARFEVSIGSFITDIHFLQKKSAEQLREVLQVNPEIG